MTNVGQASSDRMLGDLGPRLVNAGLAIGVVGLVASLGLGFMAGWDRFYESWLVAFCYFLSLGVGALFFLVAQHLTGATWSVVVRRLAETTAANLPFLIVFFIPIALGLTSLFEWASPAQVQGDHLLQGKAPYLNVPFFYIRWALYFLFWAVSTRFLFQASVRQDETGDVELTRKMEGRSAPITLGFALSTTFAAVDLLMSLSPRWYSTMFGVYFFAGSVVGFMAFLSLGVVRLQAMGRLRQVVTAEHYHDLGKLLFAFIVFWAYIGFSQYMLIWYANIPEETIWVRDRISGQWANIGWLLFLGHFLVPFFGIISRTVKKTPALLGFWAGWMLIMHWVDLYWVIMASRHPLKLPLHLLDLTTMMAVGGFFVAMAIGRLRTKSLVPLKDPRLGDSLAFENA